jgi:hypothetical protein
METFGYTVKTWRAAKDEIRAVLVECARQPRMIAIPSWCRRSGQSICSRATRDSTNSFDRSQPRKKARDAECSLSSLFIRAEINGRAVAFTSALALWAWTHRTRTGSGWINSIRCMHRGRSPEVRWLANPACSRQRLVNREPPRLMPRR